MTMTPQSPREPGGPPPDSTAPPPGRAGVFELEYARSEASARKRIVECVLGAVVTCAAVLGCAFVCVSAGGPVGVVAAPLVVAAIFGLAAFNFRRNPDRRALAAGIWVGIGVALLLDGACWLLIANSRIGG
jgi:hypothetical protein